MKPPELLTAPLRCQFQEDLVYRVQRFVLGAWLLVGASAAVAQQDIRLYGKVTVVRPGRATVSAYPPYIPAPPPAPGSPNDPTLVGASLEFRDLGGAAGTNTYSLPSGKWSLLGSPSDPRGYRYRGAGTPGDPCRLVVIKPQTFAGKHSPKFRALCIGPDVTLMPPFAAGNAITLSIGAPAFRYCAIFGPGSLIVRNDATVFKAREAFAASCASPSGAFIDDDLE
jgi:hypothetical protein